MSRTIAGESPLVAIVGIDGSGKSSSADLAARALRDMGLRTHTFHPRAYPEKWLLEQMRATGRRLPPATAYQWTMCGIVNQCVTRLVPLLDAADWVVADRYACCTVVRAIASGVSSEVVELLTDMALATPKPALTLWLDVEPAVARTRILERSGVAWPVTRLSELRDAYERVAVAFGLVRVRATDLDRQQSHQAMLSQILSIPSLRVRLDAAAVAAGSAGLPVREPRPGNEVANCVRQVRPGT